MRLADGLIAVAALGAPAAASAQIVAGNRYACDVSDAAGTNVPHLSVTLRRTADVPDGRPFNATTTPLWVTIDSDSATMSRIEMPTSRDVLRDGRFLVTYSSSPAVGTPPIAPSIGVRLVLDGDAPVNNGYVVVYRQQAGAHFETVETGPQEVGLCRTVRTGATR